MKKSIYFMCIILVLGCFTACTSKETEERMHINKAELSEEEKDIADLIGVDLKNTIFDFTVDETIKTVQINSYRLKDGEWDMIAGGRTAIEDKNGRIALIYENSVNGIMRIALQSENFNASTSHTIPKPDEAAATDRVSSYLSNDTEIEYEKEIPLLIQISTAKNEIISYNVEYFDDPEEYQKLGYEQVYAVTVMFSQKTLAELDKITDNK